jgi:hypothetical protein
MSEMAKTIAMVCAAAVAIVASFVTRPKYEEIKPSEFEGKPLFADFTDPYKAKSMVITEYDDARDVVKQFEIAQVNGIWSIPSHENYPADAEENLKNAATQLVNLNVIKVVEGGATDYEEFGLIAPDAEDAKEAKDPKSVGKQIVFKDQAGKTLADVIVGKEVPGMQGQRFVRLPKQQPIYIVEIDPGKVPTSFKDWIEPDLLDLNAFDIASMTIRDYSVETGQDLRGNVLIDPQQRLTATVNWNAQDFKWELEELIEMRDDRIEAVQLTESEELNKQALDDMKTALDDLKIVDVAAKPEGLRADLTAEEGFANSREGMQSLVDKGYYPARDPSGQVGLYSTDGEIEVATKDGVAYRLRFGGVADYVLEDGESQAVRYVMVTASVDESAFEEPKFPAELEGAAGAAPPPPLGSEDSADDSAADSAADIPAENADATEAEAEADTEAEADDPAPCGQEVAEDAQEDSEEESEEVATEASDGQDESAEEPAAEQPAAEEPVTEQPATEEPATSEDAEPEVAAEATNETPAADAAAPATTSPDAEATGDEGAAPAVDRDALLKEYQRQKDEYNEKRKKAEERVRDLNTRFAPWYYMMSDEDYRKIHLGRSDIIVQKEGEGTGVDSLRSLEDKGLNREAE